jgi:hypothetical protein
MMTQFVPSIKLNLLILIKKLWHFNTFPLHGFSWNKYNNKTNLNSTTKMQILYYFRITVMEFSVIF